MHARTLPPSGVSSLQSSHLTLQAFACACARVSVSGFTRVHDGDMGVKGGSCSRHHPGVRSNTDLTCLRAWAQTPFSFLPPSMALASTTTTGDETVGMHARGEQCAGRGHAGTKNRAARLRCPLRLAVASRPFGLSPPGASGQGLPFPIACLGHCS